MATTNEGHESETLAPPTVTALRQEGPEQRGHVDRTNSIDIREEREDLKRAAEQSLNVILDLNLDGTIRWASPSWKEVVGTEVGGVIRKPIADLLLSNKDAFANAVESMKTDDSKSRIVRFKVEMGPFSVLRRRSTDGEDVSVADRAKEDVEEDTQELNLEGQGIMVYDRSSGGESHVCVGSSICNVFD